LARKARHVLKSSDQPLSVAVLVCPGFLQADVLGAHTVFGLAPNTVLHLVWKTLDPVVGLPAWPTVPTMTFEDCPDIDVIIIGMVPPKILADPEVIAFLQRKVPHASAVLGICGGALLLGAAGLLVGRRATASFTMVEALGDLGAIVVPGGEVVVDGPYYTAGPVLGSFEAALVALAALRGEAVARAIELGMEYEAHPPFGVGSPALAGPELTAQVAEEYRRTAEAMRATARKTFQARHVESPERPIAEK
jgi:transcriptional regulator GlxA family with amidase domain